MPVEHSKTLFLFSSPLEACWSGGYLHNNITVHILICMPFHRWQCLESSVLGTEGGGLPGIPDKVSLPSHICCVFQQPPIFLAPGTGFLEASFSKDCRGRDGFWMIQVHYIPCALYFYYYYISSTSDHQALDPRGWGPLIGNSCTPLDAPEEMYLFHCWHF